MSSQMARISGPGVLSALLFLACHGLLTSTALAQKWGKVPPEEWALQPPAKYPEVSAIVIFDIGSLKVTNKEIAFKRHKRIKIFRKEGSDEAAQAKVYSYDKDRLAGLEAQTLFPDGKITEARKKDFLTQESGSYKTTIMPFPAVEDGCILEYQYESWHSRYTFLDPWTFQSGLFTMRSAFTLDLAPGFAYNACYENAPPELRHPKREGDGIFQWEMTNLSPVEREPYMAAPRSYLASMHCQLVSYRDDYNNIRFIESWSDLGKEFQEIVDDFTRKRRDLPGLVASICRGTSAPLDTIEHLYNYVRDSIETRDEEGQLYPDQKSIQDILRLRYGNSSEKNLLLVELLRAAAIEADPLLITTRDDGVFNPEIFQVSQFSKIVCRAEIAFRSYVLDTEDEDVPFPFVPPADLVGRGLLLKGEESSPIEFDHFRRPSGLQLASRLWVRQDGSATCSTHVTVRGYFLSKYEDLLKGHPTKNELSDLLMRDDRTVFTIVSADSAAQTEADSAWFDVVLDLPAFGTVAGDRLFFRPLALWHKSSPFTKAIRSFPVDFNYRFMVSSRTEVNLAERMELAEGFADVSIKIEPGSFSRTTLRSGNSTSILSGLYITQAIVPPAGYPELKNMFDRVVQSGAEEMSAVIK